METRSKVLLLISFHRNQEMRTTTKSKQSRSHCYRKPYPKRLITAGSILTGGDVLSPPAQNGAGGDRYNGHHRRFVTRPGGDANTTPYYPLPLILFFSPILSSHSPPPPVHLPTANSQTAFGRCRRRLRPQAASSGRWRRRCRQRQPPVRPSHTLPPLSSPQPPTSSRREILSPLHCRRPPGLDPAFSLPDPRYA